MNRAFNQFYFCDLFPPPVYGRFTAGFNNLLSEGGDGVARRAVVGIPSLFCDLE